MSIIRAKVTKEFDGVEDGKVHPRLIQVGEEIHGSLAETAIGMKHAKETNDSKADRAAEAESDNDALRNQQEVDELAAKHAAKRADNIEKLKLLPHEQLVALADEYQIDISGASMDPEIIDLIEASFEVLGVEVPAPADANGADKSAK